MLASVIIAYLLGSIPCGYIIGKIRGKDIRRYGSGNIGTTNALRVLGLPAALIVLLGDTAKGLVGVLLGYRLGGSGMAAALSGIAAVCGHNWSLFLGFKGGKGVATSLGAAIGLSPVLVLPLVPVWLAAVVLTRYVSLGSILAALAAPIAALIMHQGWPVFSFALVAGAMIIWRHKSNIQRLRAGTELKLGDRN